MTGISSTFAAAAAVVLVTVVAVSAGLLALARRFKHDHASLADQIDAILPQTQCGRCDYSGCKPYAEAIAAGQADINQCPPGGQSGVDALARLLGREPVPLNPEHGAPGPPGGAKIVAIVDEHRCIGCTRCIQACPVDAIVGATKLMHTVIEVECTGCELCLPACPVDCIDLVERPGPAGWARRMTATDPAPPAVRITQPGRSHG